MNQISQFLILHGGLILFAIAFTEQFGLPLPGAPWLMAAGALSASGKFSLLAAIGWAAAGCVVADAIWFFLGHRGKARVFRVFPHLHSVQVRLERATLAKTVLHGTRMLTVAKFLPFGTVIPMHPRRVGGRSAPLPARGCFHLGGLRRRVCCLGIRFSQSTGTGRGFPAQIGCSFVGADRGLGGRIRCLFVFQASPGATLSRAGQK